MTITELKQLRLYNHHLTAPVPKLTAACDLLGVQSQFTVNAYHALRTRSSEVLSDETWGEGLCKNWTIRGTIHVFALDDLGLFRYREDLYRNSDFTRFTFREGGWCGTPERQKFWSEKILSYVENGIREREALKAACIADGITDAELECMFESWGGGMRDLCERGFLVYAAKEKKEFLPAPEFMPMGQVAAEREMVRRYFTHYAPATLRDAAYFFGWTQTKLKGYLKELPVESVVCEGKTYYYIGALPTACPDVPRCILLAGFDQLMLGYEKKDSIFVPTEFVRGIFNLQGIVLAPVLLDGTIAGKWKCKDGKLNVECFRVFSQEEKNAATEEAERWYGKLKKAEFLS